MTQTRKSWAQDELEEKEIILKRFWDECVNSPDATLRENSLRNLKNYFLRTHPPRGTNIKDWGDKLNREWADGSAFKDKDTFYSYFTHIASMKSVGYAENLVPARTFGTDSARVSSTDLAELAQYAQDKDVAISSAFGSIHASVQSSCTGGCTTSDVISTQSVTKVFTGVLALRLLEEDIISHNEFTRAPLQISDTTRQTLEAHGKTKILGQLETVSLHQALTHHGGLGVGEGISEGDYYGAYLVAVESAKESDKPYPEITSVNSFLQFIPNQVSISGPVDDGKSFVYSNSGIILAALSLEHLYNKFATKHPERNLPPLDFDGILKQYVTGPSAANMKCFEASPENLPTKFNPDDQLSMHMVGTPGGGYHTTVEDLQKFAKWLGGKCHEEKFQNLVVGFGQEFCPNPESHRIEHTGDGPFNSMFFSLNWENGNVVIVANNQGANIASEVGRLINENILMRPQEKKLSRSSSTGNIADMLGVSPATLTLSTTQRQEPEKNYTIEHQSSINMELKFIYDQDQHDRLSIATLDPMRDAARKEAAMNLIESIAQPTKEDYYHAAIIFQHGNCEADYKLAHELAQKSVALGDYKPSEMHAADNRFLVASTYDRWQLNQDPPNPQKFGTQYAGKDDEKLGWKKDELIPPNPKHQYDRLTIDKERSSIGLGSIEQQERDWGIKRDSVKLK